jgi:hypothetical protein
MMARLRPQAILAWQDHRCTPHSPINAPFGSKSTSITAFVCPFTVRSNSPPSQSQILTVESSLAEATTVHVGWNATRVIGDRCEVRVCRAGARGMKGAEEDEEDVARVGEASSARRAALRDSRSMI